MLSIKLLLVSCCFSPLLPCALSTSVKIPSLRIRDLDSRSIEKHSSSVHKSTAFARHAGTRSYNPINYPNTGVVRQYHFTISRSKIAPDGVSKSAILVNNQFPGPTIEANWGDTFKITVHNNISGPSEGTLLHWHGLRHKGQPWYDGVPAVDMCPIAPGDSFTYNFIADQYGTSWWHSHYSGQMADGLWGPMIIHGPIAASFDIDLGPISLTGNIHIGYEEALKEQFSVPPAVLFTDTNLINGKGTFDCSQITDNKECRDGAEISTFNFESNRTHLLRLINTGAEGTQHFTIDEHEMTVIANDYIPIKPYKADFITLGVGQRTDILVKANADPTKSYYMRANISSVCDPILNGGAVAAIYYPKADKEAFPTSTPVTYNVNSCLNDPLNKTVPLFPMTPTAQPSITETIDVTLGVNASGHRLIFMNGASFRGNYNHPILLLAQQGNTSYPEDPQWNVYNVGSNSSVRIIIYNRTPLFHPIHLHGHNFWVIAEGVGEWGGEAVNPENPQRRDVHIMPAGIGDTPGYLVLEFETDNPGVWPLHCHISWHVAAGMYVNIIERPEEIKKLRPPHELVETCRGWWNYSGHETVNQIDSGLKLRH